MTISSASSSPALAGAAGGVPVEDGGLPAADGAGQATHLGDVAGVGPGGQQLEGVAGAVDEWGRGRRRG
jgi:hypothetical protein